MKEMYEKSAKDIRRLLFAKYPALYIQSEEDDPVIRSICSINKMFDKNKEYNLSYHIYSWNSISGFYPESGSHNLSSTPSNNLESALKYIEEYKERSIFIIQDAHFYMDGIHSNFSDPIDVFRIKETIRKISMPLGDLSTLRYNNVHNSNRPLKHIIFISSKASIPNELRKLVVSVDFELPGKFEIQTILNKVIENDVQSPTESEINEIINASLGLTEIELFNVYEKSKANPTHPRVIHPKDVYSEKKQIVKSAGNLSFEESDINLSDIGGMKPLISWIEKRAIAYDDAIREKWHLDSPKGILFTGIPGCGKSLLAKAIPNFFGMPLLRFDMGATFNKWVGESEKNARRAIKVAESVSPCVLWIDEIEKGIPNAKTQSHETSNHVFQTLLTWLQEKTSPVFVVATANNIGKLPPELLRKGRFDELFFVDLPKPEERTEIFKIHLKRKQQNIDNFNLEALVNKTKGFSGAEIQSIINESLFSAAVEKEPLNNQYILNEIDRTKPLSESMKDELNEIRKQSTDNNIRKAN